MTIIYIFITNYTFKSGQGRLFDYILITKYKMRIKHEALKSHLLLSRQMDCNSSFRDQVSTLTRPNPVSKSNQLKVHHIRSHSGPLSCSSRLKATSP